jgi:hypothetical protein
LSAWSALYRTGLTCPWDAELPSVAHEARRADCIERIVDGIADDDGP